MLPAAALTLLAGCTHIENVNVLTVAQDCDVERAEQKQAGGEGDADILMQSGQAAGQFLGALRSTIVCRDRAIEAEVRGSVTE